jgi:hypothetical protein
VIVSVNGDVASVADFEEIARARATAWPALPAGDTHQVTVLRLD